MKLRDKVLEIFREIDECRKDGLKILVGRKYKELDQINDEYFVIQKTVYWPEDQHEDFIPMHGTVGYTFMEEGGYFDVCQAVTELVDGKLEIRTIEVSNYVEPEWKHEKARARVEEILNTELN